ncbi:sigma-70 family RNA polymerase sigma factor [bacterium]|nr:sigma-70 family RNA polymerase sigma factor [bacterium]
MNEADRVYRELIEPVKKRMMTAISRLVRNPDDAADVFQDALFKIWAYLDRILEHPNPHAYILNICNSVAYDFLRKRNITVPNSPHLSYQIDGDATTADSVIHKQELIAIIQRALANLPLQQAQAVFLRLFEEESFRAIASVLDCTEATARSHFSKGLARLRNVLNEWDISLSEVS